MKVRVKGINKILMNVAGVLGEINHYISYSVYRKYDKEHKYNSYSYYPDTGVLIGRNEEES